MYSIWVLSSIAAYDVPILKTFAVQKYLTMVITALDLEIALKYLLLAFNFLALGSHYFYCTCID